MATTAQQRNLAAAKWSPNGHTMGASDLDPGRQRAVRQQRLQHRRAAPAPAASPSSSSSSARSSAASRSTRRWPTPSPPRCASGRSSSGASHYTHWFQPLTGIDRREARLVLRARPATAPRSPSSPARSSSAASRTRRRSRPAASARPSRRAATPPGTRPARRSSSRTRTARCSASRRRSPRGRARRSTSRSRCCARWTRCRVPPSRALRLLGDDEAERVFTTVGCEQEYFLIDEAYYYSRPDLITTGRTLFGAQPPKGHELDDHYFGSIPPRMLAYMLEVEARAPEARRPGQDPPQRGRAGPVRDRADVRELEPRRRPPAADHADPAERRPQLRARLPAAREAVRRRQRVRQAQQLVDGHRHGRRTCSIRTTPNFLFFCTAVIEAVNKHQGLLRASIAGVGQDHRLGANEAPPAIISIFLGSLLQNVYDRLEHGDNVKELVASTMHLGTDQLPELPRDAGDRNRTSPFAFTGNKFEFRALGSSASPSLPNTVLNTIVAESIDRLSNEVESRGIDALPDILKESWNSSKQVVFNGDNYSEEWHKEAEQRGLLNLRTTPDALPELVKPETKEVLEPVRGAERARDRGPLRGLHRAVHGEGQHRGGDRGDDRADPAPAGGGQAPGHAACGGRGPRARHADRRAERD